MKPLLRQCDRLGLGDCLTFEGEATFEEIVQAFEWADCFLFTGRIAGSGDRDGLPNVIPEAMAFGVPVLATTVGGVTEAVVDGRTGILLTGSTMERARGILRLAEDRALRARIRAGGSLGGRKFRRAEECGRACARVRAGCPGEPFGWDGRFRGNGLREISSRSSRIPAIRSHRRTRA